MIISFKHKGLEKFFKTGKLSGIQAKHANKLCLILTMLNIASSFDGMKAPGLRFHELKGDRKGTGSVSVSGNWRVTFKMQNQHAIEVDYEDYH